MNKKFKKEVFSYLEKKDLKFTKEDRIETLNKIQDRNDQKQGSNIALLNIGKRYVVPVLGSIMVLILAIVILLPDLNFGNEIVQENSDKQQAAQHEGSSFSVLIMGKGSAGEFNRRSNINLLLTYNSDPSSINIVAIPRDTYVEIFNSEGEMIGQDKVMHASALDPDSESAKITVSNLFDISIDYHSVISEENIYGKLGITKEDARKNKKLMNEMDNLIKEQLSASEIKTLLEESETNIPRDLLNQMENINSSSMQMLDVTKGMEEKLIDGVYYVEINQKLLEKTSNTLKKHLGDN
ncbi:transcriptional attenuator, LytR family [Alteribacillus persepolensis]|uniref:Transcriptional attenuator, LytR family n=1 Tax=Alteribacillus persepolensis TaxID=568899 RepID=A0A1G8KMH1_9BACI|nr:LCP family protein [Alteribacillus persepolensis]SDI44624.1 transcriptional attenuator, LytR family [Alteribacillus persepolensis]